MLAADVAHGEGLLAGLTGDGAGLENKRVAAGESGRELVLEEGGVVLGGILHAAIPVAATGHQDVEHVVLEAVVRLAPVLVTSGSGTHLISTLGCGRSLSIARDMIST